MLVVYFKTLQQNPGQAIEPKLCDVVNLLSGYFFMLALHLNQLEGGAEVPFVSRNYQLGLL